MIITVNTPGHGKFSIDDQLLLPYQQQLDGLLKESGKAFVLPTRSVYAAAHVVMQNGYTDVKHSLKMPGRADEIAEWIDWPATMSIRKRLDGHGFGIAEAMDTAQRFFLGWESDKKLIQECGKLNLANGFIAGAGVDHLTSIASMSDLVDGVVHQVQTIHAAGGEAILLPMLWLAENGASEKDYVRVYQDILMQLEKPVCIHWLGEMFLPALKGYFPGDSFMDIMALGPGFVAGCKLSLLDAELEITVRHKLLQRGQVVWTGDDFNFAELILGEEASDATSNSQSITFGNKTWPIGNFSHALLGVFDGIAAPASLALQFLALGDHVTYSQLMKPAEAFGQWVFQAPTQHYKCGLAFVAWLNGWQENRMLVNHEETKRNMEYYLKTAELAAKAGALEDATVAAKRLQAFMEGNP